MIFADDEISWMPNGRFDRQAFIKWQRWLEREVDRVTRQVQKTAKRLGIPFRIAELVVAAELPAAFLAGGPLWTPTEQEIDALLVDVARDLQHVEVI